MATFTGTDATETITPTEVTPSVTAYPLGSLPSDAVDMIFGREGDDADPREHRWRRRRRDRDRDPRRVGQGERLRRARLHPLSAVTRWWSRRSIVFPET